MTNKHIPVLLHEALDALGVTPGKWYIDGTFGRGGHTEAILNKGGNVIAFDQDHEAIEYGTQHFQEMIVAKRLLLIHENFSTLSTVTQRLQREGVIDTVYGVLFDFGTSTEQLTSAERGFSFEGTGPLDMRMDTRLGVQAKDLLAVLPENQLAQLFREYGGEDQSKAVAKAIKRTPEPITTVEQLSQLVIKVKRFHRGHLHPATKVFQALRIAVNSELDAIEQTLTQALECLTTKGKIVTIAFHEGEDRIVKTTFKEWENNKLVTNVQRIKPSTEEVEQNPRSRSAVLRSAEKI